jgi:hypothetical protein
MIFPSSFLPLVCCDGLTQDRYENPLLLALARKHVQFKESVASSLASLGQLDFSTALQKSHSARELALQLANEAPKGSCTIAFLMLAIRACKILQLRVAPSCR